MKKSFVKKSFFKSVACLMALLALSFLLVSCSSEASPYISVFIGDNEYHAGDTAETVTLEKGDFLNITVLGHGHTVVVNSDDINVCVYDSGSIDADGNAVNEGIYALDEGSCTLTAYLKGTKNTEVTIPVNVVSRGVASTAPQVTASEAVATAEPVTIPEAVATAEPVTVAVAEITETTGAYADAACLSGIDLSGVSLIMVNYWEPWCGYCVMEMPDLEQLYQNYKDKGLLVVGVYSYADGAKQVIADTGVTYPCVYLDGGSMYAASAVPDTVFVTPDFRLLAVKSDEVSQERYDAYPYGFVGSADYSTWEERMLKRLAH